MDRVKIKEKAKETIKGRIWTFIAPSLLVSLIAGLIGGIIGFAFAKDSSVGEMLNVILEVAMLPITVGLLSYYMKLVRGKSVEMAEITKWYNLFGGIFVMFLLIGIFTTLWTLLFIIPGIIAAISYKMAPYIFIDGEHDGASCIKKSKELMNGYKADYFVFQLSFIGWIILGVFTLGILYFWLIPYMTAADIIYYDELKKVKIIK